MCRSPKDATEAVGEEPLTRKDVVLEVNGKRFEVAAWVPETAGAVLHRKATNLEGLLQMLGVQQDLVR